MRSVLAPALAMVLTCATISAVAQTKSRSSKTTKSTATAKEASKYHRLPAHYGKLKLKDDQVQEIYQIREKYGTQIDELKSQIEKLQQEMNDEVEDVLTTTQKSALTKIKNATSSASSSRSTSSKSSSSRRSTSSSKKK